MGIQAAQPGRELRREHVNRALGEIHRGAALVSFAVERAALAHVVRDIGDVYAEPVMAVGQLLDRDRIVEIASVLAVDGDGHQRAEVGAAADVALGDRGAELERLGNRLAGVRVRDAVFADDDLGVDARRVDVAEDIGDPPDRAARRGRPASEFERHHLARRRAALLSGRDDDVHQHAAIEGHDVAHPVFVAVVAADDPFVGALENPDDPPFGATAVLDALDPDDDAVAVHRVVEVSVADVDVAAAGVERPLRGDEAVARRMRLQPADIEVHFFGQAEALPANMNEVARRDERLDMTLERRLVVLRHFENL